MSPERSKIINGRKVEEYYWSRRYPVYVDHQLVEETFDQACERLERETEKGAPP